MSDQLPNFTDTRDDFLHFFDSEFGEKPISQVSKAVDQARKFVTPLSTLGEYKYNKETYETTVLARAFFVCAAHCLVVSTKFNAEKPNMIISSEAIGDKSISYVAPSGGSNNFFSTTSYGQEYLSLTRLAYMASLSC